VADDVLFVGWLVTLDITADCLDSGKKRLVKLHRHTPGGGVLLGIFGGGVPPASPNPDPISDQKMPFPTPFSDLASKIHTRFQT